MAEQTITVSDGTWSQLNIGGNSLRGWTGINVEVDLGLIDQHFNTGFTFNTFYLNSNGWIFLSFFDSLTSDFASSGGIIVTIDGASYTFKLNGADTTSPYNWSPSNSADVIAAHDAMSSSSVVTVTLRDSFPDAAPISVGTATLSISPVPDGDEGTSVQLMANLDVGTAVYDTIEYVWGGIPAEQLENGDTATPTWTRPNVASSADQTISLFVRFRGTGLNAIDATPEILHAADVTTRVLNILPDASAGAYSITVVRNDDINEGVSVRLRPFLVVGSPEPTYDTVEYSWTVSVGTLDDSTLENPTWTPPLIDTPTAPALVTVTATYKGTGTNAKNGTSASITGSQYFVINNVVPDVSAGNTRVSIDAVPRGDEGTPVGLSATINKRTGVYDTVTYAWTVNKGTLDDPTSATPMWTRPRVTGGDTTRARIRLTVTLRGSNITAKEGTEAVLSEVNTRPTIDNVPPVLGAVFPAVTVHPVPPGAEGTTAQLGLTLVGGNYDGLEYEWATSDGGGTFDNNRIASPVWTRPRVSGRTNVNIICAVTANGTGDFATRGTSVITSGRTTGVVLNNAPNASAGTATVAINPIPDGGGGDTVRLGAVITKGTGVYDTVAYAWTVSGGTLNDATSATPVWTRPTTDVSIEPMVSLTVTFGGADNTADSGSTFTITDQVRANVVPFILSFDANAHYFELDAPIKLVIFNPRPEITGEFVPTGVRRFLDHISVSDTTIQMALSSTVDDGHDRADLTDAFEINGAIKIVSQGTSYLFPMRSQDRDDDYTLTQPSSLISDFHDAWDGTGLFELAYPVGGVHINGHTYTRFFLGTVEYTRVFRDGEEY